MKQLQRMQGHAGAKMKKAVSDEPPQAKRLMPPSRLSKGEVVSQANRKNVIENYFQVGATTQQLPVASPASERTPTNWKPAASIYKKNALPTRMPLSKKQASKSRQRSVERAGIASLPQTSDPLASKFAKSSQKVKDAKRKPARRVILGGLEEHHTEPQRKQLSHLQQNKASMASDASTRTLKKHLQ